MAALDPFQIEQVAEELARHLDGQHLVSCFSIDKERIYLQFEHQVLHLQFFKGHAYFQLLPVEHLPKKNRLLQFKSLHGLGLDKIAAVHMDRILYLEFGPYRLYLRLFGRFAQLDLYEGDTHLESFPKGRKAYPEPPIEHPANVPTSMEEVLKFKWLNEHEIGLLEKAMSNLRLEEAWGQVLEARRKRSWFADPTADWELSQSESSFPILDALAEQARRFIPESKKREAKTLLLQNKEKELSKYAQRIRKVERNLNALQSKRSEKDKADLLMAYMHQVEPGSKQVELPDFEDGHPVRIKLDPKLSPQDNAQRFYERSKDEQKRTVYLNTTLQQLYKEKEAVEQELEQLKKEEDARTLKRTAEQLNKATPVLPYRQLEIEGYEVRVGKSAKDNDTLLRSHSSPHDLWFHAHAVSGSHVILRVQKGEYIPEHILMKVAAVAAFYSKAKSEQWVRVIYTYRKFVRKPKKANPGAVLVEKETSLLVEPELP